MRFTKLMAVMLSASVLLVGPAFAQPASPGMMGNPRMMASTRPMSYQQMMAQMQENQAYMARNMRAMQAQLTLADRTSDPARRHAAIESVRHMLNMMQGRMAQCQQMAQTMSRMMPSGSVGGRRMMNHRRMRGGMMGSPAPSGR